VRFFLGMTLGVGLWLPILAQADNGWLIASQHEWVNSGEELRLEVIRPDASSVWPQALVLNIRSNNEASKIVLLPLSVAGESASRRIYFARLPQRYTGLLQINAQELATNSLLISVISPNTPIALTADMDVESPLSMDPLPAIEPALSALEPVYFVMGSSKTLNSRFQLSFKYRLFDAESDPVAWFPALSKLHLGYTQTSFWDMSSSSMPFHDTNYRPSLFWQSKLDEMGTYGPAFLRGGLEHESNGMDGVFSRSINIAFFQPAWRKNLDDGKLLFFSPRLYGYLNHDGNPDIASYRGYVDWQFRYGDERGWLLTSRMRTGAAGYGSAQLEFSTPLRKPLFARTGGFFSVQLFEGYGESLLDYNVKKPTQLRIGFSIIR
jgi:outer membrane phospholipase A